MQNNKLLLGLLIGALALLLAIGLFFAFAEEDTVSIGDIVSTDSIVPQGSSSGTSYTVGDLSCTPASPKSVAYFIPLTEGSSGVYPTAGSSSDKVTLNQNKPTSSGYLEVDLSFENANPYLENPQVFVTFTDLDLKGDRLEWKDRVVNLFETFTLHDAEGNEIAALDSTHSQDNAFTWAVALPEGLTGSDFTLRARLDVTLELEQGPAINTIKLLNNSEMMANVAVCGNDPFDGWKIVNETVEVLDGIVHVQGMVIVDKDERYAHFPIHRYIKQGCEAKAFPSAGIPGADCGLKGRYLYDTGYVEAGFFMTMTPTGKFTDSTAGHLAANGVDVWVLESRSSSADRDKKDHLMDPDTFCGDNGTDCPELANWGENTLRLEIEYGHTTLLNAIRQESHTADSIILGGGAFSASPNLGIVGDSPDAFAGVFALGVIYSENELKQPFFSGVCQTLLSMQANGIYGTDTYFRDLYDKLTDFVEDPDGGIPGSLANKRDLLNHLENWTVLPPPASLATHDEVAVEGHFVDVGPVAPQALKGLVPIIPVPAGIDLYCPIGGDRPYTWLDDISNYQGPVYIYVGTQAHDDLSTDLQSVMPNNEFTIDSVPGGFVDHIFGRDLPQVYANPLLQWMLQQF